MFSGRNFFLQCKVIVQWLNKVEIEWGPYPLFFLPFLIEKWIKQGAYYTKKCMSLFEIQHFELCSSKCDCSNMLFVSSGAEFWWRAVLKGLHIPFLPAPRPGTQRFGRRVLSDFLTSFQDYIHNVEVVIEDLPPAFYMKQKEPYGRLTIQKLVVCSLRMNQSHTMLELPGSGYFKFIQAVEQFCHQ